MSDCHVNLFYSYNRDNELIENNLTRALIVTLSFLTEETRGRLIGKMVNGSLRKLGVSSFPSFHKVEFALQGYMNKNIISNCNHLYVLVIATDRFTDIEDLIIQDEQIEFDAEVYEDSIPDGWIFNVDIGYCFLLEAKVGTYPINPAQIYSHAYGWLEIPKEEIQNHIISLTWHDVLRAIEYVGEHISNQQEYLILKNLEEFIGFFGYRLFQGFDFKDLHLLTDIDLFSEFGYLELNFINLLDPPEFYLSKV